MIRKIPYVPGQIPPKGYILGRLPGGKNFWVHQADIKTNNVPRSVLTPEQKERLRACYYLFRDFDNRPLEQWYFNFSCDQTPEKEILVYEALAETYKAELKLRKHSHRQLLYKALMMASTHAAEVDNILAQSPELKSLPNLARAVEAYRSAWAKRSERYFELERDADESFDSEEFIDL